MSKGEAPDGASSVGQQQPAIALNRPSQGSNGVIDASPRRISKMLRSLVSLEKNVRAWEDMPGSEGDDSGHRRSGRRYTMFNGKLQWVKTGDLIGDSLVQARKTRDDHIDEIRHVIDYALTTDAYKDVACPSCRLPEGALEFAKKVVDFEPPAMTCGRCMGRGSVREKKTDATSLERFKRISYFKRTLDDFVACLKIRMGTKEAEEAYRQLEQAHKSFIIKFSSENHTALESEDAEQGVRQGLIDAARRFDPTRKEGAMYSTVAYNWCRRNSSSRTEGDKRPGVYAPSIDQLGADPDGNSPTALVTSSSGAFGALIKGSHRASKGGRRDGRCKNCGDALPWDLEHLCEPCSKTDALKKLKNEEKAQGPDLFSPNNPDPTLVFDLREKIGELPLDQRELVLMEMSGESPAAIASSLGLTTAKVRRLREKAYESLRGSMSAYVEALYD